MNPLIVILGPTASGKTELSIKLAKKFDGAIVSADSRQVYRGLDIGTSKISKEERKQISHFLIDVILPGEEFSLPHYQRLAFDAIEEIRQKEKIPFLVGGTGLYINAVVENFIIQQVPPNKSLRENLGKLKAETLQTELEKRDPNAIFHVDLKNPRRVIRAIEMIEATGKKLSQIQKKGERKYRVLKLGIEWPREELYKRSDMIIDQMFKRGLLLEVKNLLKKGVSREWLKSLGLEYRAVTEYLLGIGVLSLRETISRLKLDQHAYIRRQLTWFRKDTEIYWLSPSNAFEDAQKMITLFLCKK